MREAGRSPSIAAGLRGEKVVPMPFQQSSRRPALAGFSLAALLLAAPSALAGGDGAFWVGPAVGDWNVGINWDGGLVPDGVPVLIDPRKGASVTLNLFNAQMPYLTIGGGSELLVPMSIFAYLGGCENNGTIRFTNGSPFFSALFLTEDVDLVGGGTLDMGDNIKNVITATQTGLTLRNTATHTIRGAGTIGDTVLTLVNDGLLEASAPSAPQRLLLSSGDNINNGTMVARGGGRLRIESCSVRNTPGAVMHADNGGVVELWEGGIVNGTLTSDGSGRFRTEFEESQATDLTNEATIDVQWGTGLRLEGTIENNGLIAVKPLPGFATINCAGNVVLSGTGELTYTGSFNGLLRGTQPGSSLTNEAGHTIRGGGQFGLDELDTLINRGLLRVDAGTMKTDLKTAFVNEGEIRTVASVFNYRWELEPSGFLNTGVIAIEAFSAATMRDSLRQTAGSTRVDGKMTFENGAFFDLEGGRLGGDGEIVGNVDNTGGVVDPSLGLDEGVRSLQINGSYAQSPSGTFAVQLAPGGNDLLAINGPATLAGALAIDFAPGFLPSKGSQFTILTASSISGGFECVDAGSLGVGGIEVVVSSTAVTVVITGAVNSPADLDGDGVVGAGDLAILLGAWGAGSCGGNPCCAADLTSDGAVDAADLAVLLGQWG